MNKLAVANWRDTSSADDISFSFARGAIIAHHESRWIGRMSKPWRRNVGRFVATLAAADSGILIFLYDLEAAMLGQFG
jgi:hypothetical protein